MDHVYIVRRLDLVDRETEFMAVFATVAGARASVEEWIKEEHEAGTLGDELPVLHWKVVGSDSQRADATDWHTFYIDREKVNS